MPPRTEPQVGGASSSAGPQGAAGSGGVQPAAAAGSRSPGSKAAAKRRLSRSPSMSGARRRERAAPAAQVKAEGTPRAAAEGAAPPGTPGLHTTRRQRLAEEIRERFPIPPSMPSAATVREALETATVFNNLTGSWELQELIVRFLGEHNIADIAQFRLPRTQVHGGRRGQKQQGAFTSTDMPEEWSENTARRLEMHTARFWLRLFDAHAPRLLKEAFCKMGGPRAPGQGGAPRKLLLLQHRRGARAVPGVVPLHP